jgi:hypothetical protein
MIPDLDIYRAAKLVIDCHGEDAALDAAGRADLLMEDGDATLTRPLVSKPGSRSPFLPTALAGAWV